MSCVKEVVKKNIHEHKHKEHKHYATNTKNKQTNKKFNIFKIFKITSNAVIFYKFVINLTEIVDIIFYFIVEKYSLPKHGKNGPHVFKLPLS